MTTECKQDASGTPATSPDATAALPVFAVDVSGSTGGCKRYWAVVDKVLQSLGGSSKVTPLLWDNGLHSQDRALLDATIRACSGHGGTDPAVVVKRVLDTQFHGHLVLLTDGQVPVSSIDACARLLPLDWAFTKVDVYVIGSSVSDVNVSVGCPFMRSSPTVVYTADDSMQLQVVQAVSVEDRALLDTISTPQEFEAQYDRIRTVVEVCTRGLMSQEVVRDKLLKMQRRVIATASTRGEVQDSLLRALVEGNLPQAELLARKIIETNTNVGMDDLFHKLLRMTEGALRHNFVINGIRANAAQFAPTQTASFDDQASAIASLMMDTAPDAEPFTCPITLDDNTSQALMIHDTTTFWQGLSVDEQKQVFACPLILLAPFMKQHLARFCAQLGHVISVSAFRDLTAHSEVALSPFTRERMARAAICPGSSDVELHATNIAIHQAFTAGKKLGHVELWYIVLYYAVQQVQHLVDTPGFIAAMKEQLMRRLAGRTVYASLSGLDGTVNACLPVGAAIWFVVGAAHVHNQVTPGREAIRMHMPYSTILRELCELQGFAIGAPAKQHVNRLKALSALYSSCKFVFNEDGTRRDATVQEQQAIFNKLKQLYQASRDGVLLDGPPAEPVTARSLGLPAACWFVSPTELVSLSRLVNPQSRFGRTVLPHDWTPDSSLPDPITTFDYAYVRAPLPICPATARPWYTVPGEAPLTATWATHAATKFDVSDVRTLLPMHRWIMEYVRKFEKLPTATELVQWLSSKYPTLHARVFEMAEDGILDYKPLFDTLSIEELCKRYGASRKITNRQAMEAGVLMAHGETVSAAGDSTST